MESSDQQPLTDQDNKPPDDDESTRLTRGLRDQNLKCVVCGDRASGLHYKVLSCDGCRTVRKGLDEVCRNRNRCGINKTTRTACKPCRFRKCLEVAVQLNGNRSTKTEQKMVVVPANPLKPYPFKMDQICHIPSEARFDLFRENSLLNGFRPGGNEILIFPDSNPSKYVDNDWTLIAKNTFRMMLRWVANPYHLKQVDEPDRSIILEENWPLIFILTLCQCYDAANVMKLVHSLYAYVENQSPNSKIESGKKRSPGNKPDESESIISLNRLRDMIIHLQYHHFDNEEFSMMKTMALNHPCIILLRLASEELRSWLTIAGNYKSAAINFISYIYRRSFPAESIYDSSNKISSFMVLLASIKGCSRKVLEMALSPALELTKPVDRVYWSGLFANNPR